MYVSQMHVQMELVTVIQWEEIVDLPPLVFFCNCITGFSGDGITCRGKLINFVVAHFQLLKNIR